MLKSERREQKRQNKRKMKVSGKSNRLLQEILMKKADKIRELDGNF